MEHIEQCARTDAERSRMDKGSIWKGQVMLASVNRSLAAREASQILLIDEWGIDLSSRKSVRLLAARLNSKVCVVPARDDGGY